MEQTNIAFQINHAVKTLIDNYCQHSGINGSHESLISELSLVFALQDPFMKKVTALDDLLEKYPDIIPVGEVLFDYLMIRYLSTDTADMDPEYFDSAEWLEIEDDTLDRGTEMLNILLYIKETQDAEVEMSLDDFLHEFLLVDDEGFQEEHRIYEEVIENAELVEEDLEVAISASAEIDEDNELKDFFIPLFAFFKTTLSPELAVKIIKNNATEPALPIAYYMSMQAFGGKI